MLRLAGWPLLILGAFVVSTAIPLWLKEEAEAFGDDALLSRPTILLLALIGLGGLSLAGIGAGLLLFA